MNYNKQTDKKCKRIRKYSYLSNPDDMIEMLSKDRFKYKEGLFRVMRFFLYRAAHGYSMYVSQATIAKKLGLSRKRVNQIIIKLCQSGFLVITYHTETRNDIVCNKVSSYKIAEGLRDSSPEFQSKMCYLFPFLAKVSFSFFCIVGALKRRILKHLRYGKVTLYNFGININKKVNKYYKDIDKRSQKESKNGLENPTHGKDASPITNIFAKFGLGPKFSMPEVRPNTNLSQIADFAMQKEDYELY
jgi:DNA-binding MarR family transcriptional regulator